MRVLAKDVTVKREERTYVVEILVTTSEAAKSARLADAVVSAFLTFSANQHTEGSRRVAASLQSRLSDLRQSVENAEQKVVEYKRQHNIVAAIGQSVTEQQLADANKRLEDSDKRVGDLRSRYNQVLQAQRGRDKGAIPEALQSLTVSNLRSQLALVVQKKDDAAAPLGPRPPDFHKAVNEERGIRNLLKEEIGRIGSVANSDLTRALADRKAAQAAFDDLRAAVTSNSELAVRLRELERELEASRTVYEAFLVRTREVAEQEQIDPVDVRVISTGQPLEGRAWPPSLILTLIAGGALGLGLGVACALLQDFAAGSSSWTRPGSGMQARHAT